MAGLLLRLVDRLRPETLAVRHGFELWIPRGHLSPLALAIYLSGEYEPEESRLVAARAAGAKLVFDVGANVGYMTCLMAGALAAAPEAEVHAFEPEPECFAILRENVARNRLRGVVLRQLALAAEGGEATLRVAVDNLADHTLVALAGRRGLTVQAVTFDDYRARECAGRRVDLVKIDVQGAELAVLRGMRGSLAAGEVDHVLCEIWPARLRAGGGTVGELAELFADLPYASLVVSDTGGAESFRTLADLAASASLDRQPHRSFSVLLSRRLRAEG